MSKKILETLAVEVSNVPIDTTGAAVTGDYYNLKLYRRILFVIAQGAWAGGTPAVTLSQATSAAGDGAKALAFTKKYTKVALTGTTWVEAAVTSNTFNLTAVANTMTAIEVSADELDADNEFDFVSLNIATPGANADLIAVFAVLGDPRFPQETLNDPKVA